MLQQLVQGVVISLLAIIVHALMMSIVIWVAQNTGRLTIPKQYIRLTIVMIPTVMVLMLAHIFEVFIWAWAYTLMNIAPAGTNIIYFAFVNYTTLGYGDIVPLANGKLLGPITAMNGTLLFGWSVAVIFDVLRRTLVPAVVRYHGEIH
jgi:hypothetical protein